MSGERKSIILFLVLTFSLSTIFWCLLARPHGDEAIHHLIIALMWCPGISAIAIRLLGRRGLKGMGWSLGSWKFWLAGFLIPIAYSLVAYVPVWLSGLGGFPDPKFVANVNSKFPNFSAEISMCFYVISIGTAAMLPAGFAALGEEIGWRGYLVPELAKISSKRNAAILSGVVWAVWHYPSILFTGYNNGGPIWYSIICFTIMVVGLSFIMAWLRFKSGSIWPCVLAHTSHNNFIEFFFTPSTTAYPITKYFTDEFGIGLAITIPIAAAIVWRIKSGKENA